MNASPANTVVDKIVYQSSSGNVAEKYKMLFDNNPLPMVTITLPDMQIIETNQAVTRHYGYTREEVLTMRSTDFLVPEEQARYRLESVEQWNDMRPGGVWRHRKKNGEILYVDIYRQDFVDNGRLARLIIGNVITEKVIAEQQVLKEKQLLRLLIDNLPDCIYVKDLDLRYLINNAANLRLMGAASEEETLGKTMFDYFPVELASQNIIYDHHVLNEKEPVLNRENIVFDKSGERRVLLSSKIPLKDRDDEVVGLLGISRDITEIRRAAEEVSAAAEKYKMLFDKNPLPMIMYNLPERKILEVNNAAISHYGYSREEFVRMTLMDLRPPEDVPHFIEETSSNPPGLFNAGSWRHRKKDGTLIVVEIFRNDIEYEGQQARLLFVNDITERKRAEEEIRISGEKYQMLASRLQDIREQERADMAREVHDELGQQLTGLKMDVTWIAKKIQGLGDDALHQRIKNILDLLDETVKTVRKIATELRPSILDDIGLTGALNWYSGEFEKRYGIKVYFHPRIKGLSIPQKMATGFFRIYQETLTNVARHAEAISVGATLFEADGCLILTITDNGKGFRTDRNSGKRTLGLLGMKERALMMGGDYEIRSTPGEGTTTTLSVPLSQENK